MDGLLVTLGTGDSAIHGVLVELLLNQRKHICGQTVPTDVLRDDDGNMPYRVCVLF